MNKFIVHITFALLLPFLGIAQEKVTGKIIDDKTKELLPFAFVYNLNSPNYRDAHSDINGLFEVNARKTDTLQISYPGYFTVKIRTADLLVNPAIKMHKLEYELEAAVVTTKESMAHRVIKNVIANRKKNNPDNLKAYTCRIYNKMMLDYSIDSASLSPQRYREVQMMINDTSSYAMMSESVTDREYTYNKNVNEVIISSKLSGFKKYQQLSMIPSMIQMFHFYDDVIEWKLINKYFLNPISPGSTSKYFFQLKDTIIDDDTNDTLFVISYKPKISSNFEGLKGLLYITSNNWAIKNVVAEPASKSPMQLKIQQSYERIDSVWFPAELSFELFFNNLAYLGLSPIYRSKSMIYDVNLSPDMEGKNFKSRNLKLEQDAYLKTDLLNDYRNPLTPRELKTYSDLEKVNLDIIFQIAEGITDEEAISAGFFNLPLKYIINQNKYEGYRLGLGVYTNQRLIPWISAGGYFGYGTKDKTIKYGTSLSVYPKKNLDHEVKLWYRKEIEDFSFVNETGISARSLLSKLNTEVYFKAGDINTLFDYSFENKNMTHSTGNALAGVNLRYAFNEKRVVMFKRTKPMSTTQPVLFLKLSSGVPIGVNSFRYQKIEIGAQRDWFIRNLGLMSLSVWAGTMSNDVPVPFMFNILDTKQSLFWNIYDRKRFNAITGDMYSSNRYVKAFLYHDFGTLLGQSRSKIFRPRLAISQAMSFSVMSNPQKHKSSEINILDMRDGYFESGLIVYDILRINFLNLTYFGLGGGVYCAYGKSVKKPIEETITPKIRISVTF